MHGGLELSWNGDISQATLNPQPVFPELYYPLWWYSGSLSTTSSVQPSGFVQKGLNVLTSSVSSVVELMTLSSNMPASQKYAWEASFGVNGVITGTFELWDMTTNSAVSGSAITTTSTTVTVIRSGQFTLIPGHQYGIYMSSSNASYHAEITDASLIIFPPAPLTSPSVSSISLANASGNTLKEAYIPLWVYSSGTASTSLNGNNFLQKGSTSLPTTSSSATTLHTLSNKWSPQQKFAFEISAYLSASGSGAVYLWDFTGGGSVATIIVSSTTATLMRSGTLTLPVNHQYGVMIQGGGTTTTYLSKAHLIALAP